MSPDRGAESTDALAKPEGLVSTEKSAVKAQTATKPPPPESQESIWSRRWIVFCFWLVAAGIGFPIWWQTTTVYRADLPHDHMYHWDAGNACSPVFPLRVALEASDFTQVQLQSLVTATQEILDKDNDFASHTLHLSFAERVTDDTALLVQFLSNLDIQAPTAAVRAHTKTLAVSLAPAMLSDTQAVALFLARELQDIFLHEHATISHMISSSPGSHPVGKSLSPAFIALLEDRKTRAVKYSPSYHLTFTLLTPSASPSDWEIEKAIRTIIKPLTRALSSVSTFTIDTQVQPYARFSSSVHPTFDDERAAWLLDQAELGSFINAAEWPLSPSIGKAATINFLLYVPAAEQSPLYIALPEGSESSLAAQQSWLIPQWGSVFILNRAGSAANGTTLAASELDEPLLAFSSHLLGLLGLPDQPSASLALRLAALRRTLTLSLLHSASSTLGALARLTQSMPSISIPEPAAASVALTLASLDATCSALAQGRFADALAQARVAEAAAERAFFDPSMVGQVYFPDEHKVAVYLPLLGPVAVPLVLALGKEARAVAAWAKGRRLR